LTLLPAHSATWVWSTPPFSQMDRHACLLWGIPHKRHYADGWVMRPAAVFSLAGAAALVL
jgi:hypothetical protein